MSGKKSRQKGRKAENEWAEKTGGERISEAGMPGPDVKTPELWFGPVTTWEVKRPASIPASVRDWLAQAEAEGAQAIAFREDYGTWKVLFVSINFMWEEV